MIVVSDASPVINLAATGQLELLQSLYNQVYIPKAVYEEITIAGAGEPGDAEVRNSDWIGVQVCHNQQLVSELSNEIDAGEAQAIVLALELKCDWLIIDEKLGRQKAKSFNIQVVGILGILLEAKGKGLIISVTNKMDALIANNFWVASDLYEEIKRIAGE